MTKLLLAMIMICTVSHIAFDKLSEHRAIAHRSPEIMVCRFSSIVTYGEIFVLNGFFEKSACTLRVQLK